MINRIHSKLGTAGFVLAIVALIAALTGAAFAAGGLTKQQEKQVKKIAKKYAGKPGAVGPQGQPGAKGDQGAKGDTGAPGTPGQDGQNGQNGEDGACSVRNPACVLPSKATMTGDWAFSAPSGGQEEWVFASISFPLQAVPAPEFGPPGENVVWVPIGGDNPLCPGTAEDPQATAGFLCIYGAGFQNTKKSPNTRSLTGEFTADTNSGFTLAFVLLDPSAEAYGFGSWAYTAA